MSSGNAVTPEAAGNDAPDSEPGAVTAPTSNLSASPEKSIPVPVLPVTGMALGGLSSAASAAYTAGGVWGLAAGGVALAGAGVVAAQRRSKRRAAALSKAMRAGAGRVPKTGLGRAGSGGASSAKRSGGVGAGRGGFGAQRGRAPGAAVGAAIRGRRAAAAGLALGGKPGAGKGRGGTGKSPSRSAHGRRHGGIGSGKPAASKAGTGKGGLFGKGRSGKHGGPASTTGPGGLPRTGKRGAHRSPGKPGRDGLTGNERDLARRGMRATTGNRTRAGRKLRAARARMASSPVGRGFLRAGRRGWRGVRAGARASRRGVLWAWAKAHPKAVWAVGWMVLHVKSWWSEMALRNRAAQATDGLKTGFAPDGQTAGERGQSGGSGAARNGEIVSRAAQMRIHNAAHELANAIAAYNSEGMLGFVEGLDEIPGALAIVAGGIQALALITSEEQPLHPAAVEAIAQIGTGQANLANTSMLLGPMVRNLHSEDIARLYNMRRNEHKWDRSYNAQ